MIDSKMNEVTIKGEIVFVDEVREYGANGFRKHQVVVETGDGKWANPIPVEFIKDSIEQSKDLKKGEKVSIDARINGREWQGKDGVTKWFTSIKLDIKSTLRVHLLHQMNLTLPLLTLLTNMMTGRRRCPILIQRI